MDGINEIQGNITFTTGNPALNISSGTGSTLTLSGSLTYTVAGNARTLYLGGASTNANMISGAISESGSGAVLSVIKQGTGVWILGGSNTYTGTTSVNAGTLAVRPDGLRTAAASRLRAPRCWRIRA